MSCSDEHNTSGSNLQDTGEKIFFPTKFDFSLIHLNQKTTNKMNSGLQKARPEKTDTSEAEQ